MAFRHDFTSSQAECHAYEVNRKERREQKGDDLPCLSTPILEVLATHEPRRERSTGR